MFLFIPQNLEDLKSYVIVQFDIDKQYDVVHSSWLNKERTVTMYPTELKGMAMLTLVSNAVSTKDASHKFKPYKIMRICASGSKYSLYKHFIYSIHRSFLYNILIFSSILYQPCSSCCYLVASRVFSIIYFLEVQVQEDGHSYCICPQARCTLLSVVLYRIFGKHQYRIEKGTAYMASYGQLGFVRL